MEFDSRTRRASTGAAVTPDAPVPGKRSLTDGLAVQRSHTQGAPADLVPSPAQIPLPAAPSDAPRPTLQMLFATRRSTPAADPSQVQAVVARGTATAATQLTLAGGVGQDGDAHERHADQVADAVVRGESAEPLLDQYAGGVQPADDRASRPASAPVQRMGEAVMVVLGLGVFLFLVRILWSALAGHNQEQRGTVPLESPGLGETQTTVIAQDLASDSELQDKAQKTHEPAKRPSDEETARELAGDEQVTRKVAAAIDRLAPRRRQQTPQEAFVAERRVVYFERLFAQPARTPQAPTTSAPKPRRFTAQPYPAKKPMGTMKDLLDRDGSSHPERGGDGGTMNRGPQTQTIVQSPPEETTSHTAVLRVTGERHDVDPTARLVPFQSIEQPATTSGPVTTTENLPGDSQSLEDPATEAESFAEMFLDYMRQLIADHIPMPEEAWRDLHHLIEQVRQLGLDELARRLERLADKTPAPESPQRDEEHEGSDGDEDDGPSDPEALAIQNFMRTTGRIAMRGTLTTEEIAYWSTHPPGPQELHSTYHWMLSSPVHTKRLLARVVAVQGQTSPLPPTTTGTEPQAQPPIPRSETGAEGLSSSLGRQQGLGACADLCKALKALNGATIPPELEDQRRALLAWARCEDLVDLAMTLEGFAQAPHDEPLNSTSGESMVNAPPTSRSEGLSEVPQTESLPRPEPKPEGTRNPESGTESTVKPPVKTARELQREQAERERQQRQDNATAVYHTIAYVQEQLRQLQRQNRTAYEQIELLVGQLHELTDHIYRDGIRAESIAKLKAYVMRLYTELHKRLTGGTEATVFTGENGVFTGAIDETTLTDWIISQSTYPMARSNAAQCARDIIAHNGRTSGGGTRFTYNGHTVFHISHGAKESSDGCTVFFVVTTDGVTIVGVGRHIGSSSYEIDWKLDGWTDSNKVQL